jgi:hypothetical protein
MRFGTWNERSLYRSGSLSTVDREFVKYKTDLEGAQEDRWDKGDTVRRAGGYIFFYEMETIIINWEQDLLYTTEQ